MCFWNNILSLFTGGKYFHVTFSPFSDAFAVSDARKRQREKAILGGCKNLCGIPPPLLQPPLTSIFFIFIAGVWSSRPYGTTLHVRMRVWYHILKIKSF